MTTTMAAAQRAPCITPAPTRAARAALLLSMRVSNGLAHSGPLPGPLPLPRMVIRIRSTTLLRISAARSDRAAATTLLSIRLLGAVQIIPSATGRRRQAVHGRNGDTYQILRASACLDQPSRSGGTLMSGITPATGWSGQVLDPTYEWMDTVSGSLGHGVIEGHTAKLDRQPRLLHGEQEPSGADFGGQSI